LLVIEYGDIEYAPGVFDPPKIIWGATGGLASSFQFSSLPVPEVNNKTAAVVAGKVVGGSSAINGMFFDRGSQYDYDAWAQAGSPEFDSSSDKWNWEGLFPYFKKVQGLIQPSGIKEIDMQLTSLCRVSPSLSLPPKAFKNMAILGTCPLLAVPRLYTQAIRHFYGAIIMLSGTPGRKWVSQNGMSALVVIKMGYAGYLSRSIP
jgi:choline dehydrogenase-like flavoprotein